jgi:O-acetyl-ADP-ribose deacetylase (regulator of RNase III)
MATLSLIDGDLIQLLRTGTIQVLAHQVNCRGVMGAGLARQIRGAYPAAYHDYRQALRSGDLQLGGARVTPVGPMRFVAHLAGQDGFGRDRRHTDYAALRSALEGLAAWHRDFAETVIGIPYGIGCGLGGGDWAAVSQLLVESVPQAYVVRYRPAVTRPQPGFGF